MDFYNKTQEASFVTFWAILGRYMRTPISVVKINQKYLTFLITKNLNIESKIRILIKNLKKIKNLNSRFINKKFYRLEQLQYRIEKKYVDKKHLTVK